MNQLLIVIPFCKADAQQAEELIEWIFELAGRKPDGHCLLVAAPDVHAEAVEKIKISASVAFETSAAIRVIGSGTNNLFSGAARYIKENFRLPFFWMEPDCTPLKRNWINALAGSYYASPMRYSGSFMQSGETIWTARCICYPNDAIDDLKEFCAGNVPFNHAGRKRIIPAASKHGLVRELLIDSPAAYGSLPKNAIAVHGDKSGLAIKAIESELQAQAANRME